MSTYPAPPGPPPPQWPPDPSTQGPNGPPTGWAPDRPPPPSPDRLARYGSWPAVLGTYAAAFAASAALSVTGADLARRAGAATADPWGEGWFLFLLILINDVVLLGAVYLLVVRTGVLSWARMGLARRPGLGDLVRGSGWGIAFIVSSAAVSLVLAEFGVVQDQAEQFPLQGAGAAERFGIFVAGVLVVPFAEEVFFRGFVFRAMTARKGFARGLLYSSVIFSAAHANVAAFLPLVVGSLGLAYAYRRSGTLWTPIVAHAFNNAFALGLLLLAPG